MVSQKNMDAAGMPECLLFKMSDKFKLFKTVIAVIDW